jgi:glycerol-3-phosphate acyltransferase PlsY
MGYFLVILLGYLMGCSSMAFYLGKLTKKDVGKNGSGNLGASNTVILLGWKAGVLVGVHDIVKAILSVLLAQWIFPDLDYAGAVAGVACILGHIFPFYLGFKGGKGLASYIGMTIALDIRVAVAVVLVLVIATLVTDFIVAGTMTTILIVPVAEAVLTGSVILALLLCLPTAVMVFKHQDNFRRILAGTEVGLRSAAKGEHRMK